MKTRLLIGAVALMALSVGVFSQVSLQQAPDDAAPPAGISFSFPDVDGQMKSIDQWRGKILVINFWATWCPPCLKEMPEFVKWQQEYADKNVLFVGISLDDQAEVADYLKTTAVNYPILVAGDQGAKLAHELGNIVGVVPFSVIVDQAGKIVHRQPGELKKDQFIEVVQPLLARTAG
jgi:thiol-disulfide isomerase/thioredoxin